MHRCPVTIDCPSFITLQEIARAVVNTHRLYTEGTIEQEGVRFWAIGWTLQGKATEAYTTPSLVDLAESVRSGRNRTRSRFKRILDTFGSVKVTFKGW